IEFLLLDSIFPRSAVHCLGALDEALETLAKLHGNSFDRLGAAEPGRRIVGRALASLRFRALEDIIVDFDEEMEQLQRVTGAVTRARSEEHTSELQSRFDLVCRLLLEKKKRSNTERGWRV